MKARQTYCREQGKRIRRKTHADVKANTYGHKGQHVRTTLLTRTDELKLYSARYEQKKLMTWKQ